MASEKARITENLIREIRTLAKLSEELTAGAREIRAEIAWLQEQLGLEQQFDVRPCQERTSKPN
jgi:hypothetical protein